jgi:beta-glucosidase
MTDKIQTLISQMTVAEKAALCTGATAWTTTAVERLGIPRLLVSDGPHGIRRITNLESVVQQSLPATCFPTASSLAATWDPDLLHAVGEALAEEAIALDVDVILGPGVNMKRTPLCGRNFEYFAEDPYLAGEMAVGLISGIQSKGVGTSVKHYAANNQEFERFSINAEVDERALREIYLPAFETAVTRAQPWTIMCAYNKVNGTHASEHHQLLTEILKEEWGLEGFVMSDWGAVHDRVASLKGGWIWKCPAPKQRASKMSSKPSTTANWTRRSSMEPCAAFYASSSKQQKHPKAARLTGLHIMPWRAKWPPKGWCCSKTMACCRCKTRSTLPSSAARRRSRTFRAAAARTSILRR